MCIPRINVQDVLKPAYDFPTARHFLYLIMARLECFHWLNKPSAVISYCRGCMICQRTKNSRETPFGSPPPLMVPSWGWRIISMEFVIKLPFIRKGFDAITIFVARFTKRVQFVPCHFPDSAVETANIFLHNICRLHGFPDSTVSDSDPKFMSKIWQTIMHRLNIKLKMCTTHHPQTDWAAEVMNWMLQNYIRCYCNVRKLIGTRLYLEQNMSIILQKKKASERYLLNLTLAGNREVK